MFKKFGLAIIIALAFCFTGFAKTNVNLGKGFVSPGNENEELIKQLAADIDFRNYYTSDVEFVNKIIKTKSGKLFYKYIKNSATDAEQTALFKQMDVADKKAFDAIAVKKYKDAKVIAAKFTALQKYTPDECKLILKAAFVKIEADKSIAVKFASLNPQQCYQSWTACIAFCNMACYPLPGYQDCMWDCSAECSDKYSNCVFNEE